MYKTSFRCDCPGLPALLFRVPPQRLGHLADVRGLAAAAISDVVDAHLPGAPREVSHVEAGELRGLQAVREGRQPCEPRGLVRAQEGVRLGRQVAVEGIPPRSKKSSPKSTPACASICSSNISVTTLSASHFTPAFGLRNTTMCRNGASGKRWSTALLP